MTQARAATYREVFAVSEFRALFLAHAASVVGDQFARVALAVLVYSRTGSASLTALTYALTFLPQIVAGPLLSGLADRFPRRRVMIAADLARAVLVAMMALPGLPLVVIGGLLVMVQLLAAPFDAARAATLPLVLEGDRYVVGSAVSNITYQLAQLLGFAAGGLLVANVNPGGALLIDSATFVVSAALVRFGVTARRTPEVDSTTTAIDSWARRLQAGVRLVWGDQALRALVGLLCISAFPLVAEGLAVPYADLIDIGIAGVGLLLAAQPAGSVVGMILIQRLHPAWRLRLMRPLAVASCAVLVVCAAQPGMVATIALWSVSGVAQGYFIVANAEFVKAVPDSQRGQAFGLAAMALHVTQGMTVLLAGAAADVVGPAMVIAVAGGIGAVAAWEAGTRWLRASASADAPAPADASSS